MFERCLIYIRTDKHNTFLFGKYENFKDLKTVYVRDAPLATKKRFPNVNRFVFLHDVGIYSAILVETIEKLKKCKAVSFLRFELLETPDVKDMVTKIYEFNCLTE